jgi:hypothetical protein
MATHIVLGLTPERASHGRKCLGCNEVPLGSRGSGSSSIVLDATLSGVRSTYVMIIDHIHRYPCSWHAIMLHDRIAHVVKEVMLEAGATKGWELCLEVRRIRSGVSRYQHGGVVRLDLCLDTYVSSPRC